MASQDDVVQPRKGARTAAAIGSLGSIALFAGLVLPPARAQAVPDYAAIVAAPDRSDADRETDQRRDPTKFLDFAGPRPGMKVLDMGAGGGYSSELMARAVAPNGIVYRAESERSRRPGQGPASRRAWRRRR